MTLKTVVVVLVLSLGVALRCLCFQQFWKVADDEIRLHRDSALSGGWAAVLGDSNPIHSWKHLTEARHMLARNGSPYANPNAVHCHPLVIALFDCILTSPWPRLAHAVFILADLLTVISVSATAKWYSELVHASGGGMDMSSAILLVAFMNPLSIAFCALMNTSLICDSLAIAAMALFATAIGLRSVLWLVPSALCFAVATVLDVYPSLIVAGFVLSLAFAPTIAVPRKRALFVFCTSFVVFVCAFALLTLSVFQHYTDNRPSVLLRQVYLFAFDASDMSPNTGPFWYLRTQMFERFLPFFTVVFQCQICVFLVPLFVRFGALAGIRQTLTAASDWLLPAYVLLHCYSVLRCYPCLAQVSSVCLPLFFAVSQPLCKKEVVCLLALCISLPLMCSDWHMWFLLATGNPNFFYGAELIFILANLYLISNAIAKRRKLDANYPL